MNNTDNNQIVEDKHSKIEEIKEAMKKTDSIRMYQRSTFGIFTDISSYSSHAKMEKRGSRYLRWALLNAAAYVCNWEPTFAAYLQKKRSEGKHYYVALSHAAKKLVRVLYHLETTGETYSPTAILS